MESLTKKLNSSTDSQLDEHSHRHRHHHRRRRSSNLQDVLHPSQQQQKLETAQSRRRKLLQNHNSTSFSLENIYFEGILSEGICDPKEKQKYSQRRRILSFEDLPAIKKELSESSQEGDYSMVESEQYRHYTTAAASKSTRLARKAKLKALRQQASTSTTTTSSSFGKSIDHSSYARLSRNEILNLWNSSEKELLNRLDKTIQQNRALEEKIELLQRMLEKPP
ncbi:hypothetical protein BLA29_005876 [Euroglyphus maynei]|uniref:Uncharacterized protein n=1 Tax=Euroglyphus maynei TaxID=6958 RepID=A0A1Y3BP99_EURMA|nr:hypothetical protein BLA29_005876 [Euroglyphus maynei]